MQKHEQVHRNLKQIIINNFMGGIAWGIGATVGVSAVLTVAGILLAKASLVPIVGNFVSQVVTFVLQNNPNLLK